MYRFFFLRIWKTEQTTCSCCSDHSLLKTIKRIIKCSDYKVCILRSNCSICAKKPKKKNPNQLWYLHTVENFTAAEKWGSVGFVELLPTQTNHSCLHHWAELIASNVMSWQSIKSAADRCSNVSKFVFVETAVPSSCIYVFYPRPVRLILRIEVPHNKWYSVFLKINFKLKYST